MAGQMVPQHNYQKRSDDMNAWILLAVAIAFEIAGTSLLKASGGFARWGLGMASMACYWVCFGFLAAAIKTIPVGVAYAIWSGVGIVAIALIGWVVYWRALSIEQRMAAAAPSPVGQHIKSVFG